MSWIKTIPYDQADSKLKRIYDKVKSPNGQVDNVLSIHSLRPHSLVGHMALYKNVLHNSNNQLPKWYLEAIGIYVSKLNKCEYCVSHHFAGLQRLLADNERSEQYKLCLENDDFENFFDAKFIKGIQHARDLTLNHNSISRSDIDVLRKAGFDDGEILEINQVTCYFNYVNRMVVGLGVSATGEELGLSPNDSSDPDNWEHN